MSIRGATTPPFSRPSSIRAVDCPCRFVTLVLDKNKWLVFLFSLYSLFEWKRRDEMESSKNGPMVEGDEEAFMLALQTKFPETRTELEEDDGEDKEWKEIST
jgi:hypothetical protein